MREARSLAFLSTHQDIEIVALTRGKFDSIDAVWSQRQVTDVEMEASGASSVGRHQKRCMEIVSRRGWVNSINRDVRIRFLQKGY